MALLEATQACVSKVRELYEGQPPERTGAEIDVFRGFVLVNSGVWGQTLFAEQFNTLPE